MRPFEHAPPSGESPSLVFHDIAQLLESAAASEGCVTRVLARLAALVPYRRCAVLDAPSGGEPRLIAAPGTPADDEAALAATTLALIRPMAERHGRSAGARPPSDAHLAVPLISRDEVVGVLFVDRADGAYVEQQVQALSVVAAKLAAYFSLLHALRRETAHGEELLKASRSVEGGELPLVRSAAAVEAPGARRLAGVRVLIVDDDRDIGEVLQFVLEGQGAVVSVAASAAEALSEMSRTLPDVLLSDIAMPGGSGYDLLRLLVTREGKNAPPAAALSAYAPGQDLDEALAAGFRMLLEKPIDPQTLISAVATLAVEARDQAPTQLLVERALVD